MRRPLPLFLWIALCSVSLIGYSGDFTVAVPSASTSLILTTPQANTVSGKVTDENGVGMPGVNVLLQGTSYGTTTDAEGVYRLSIPGEHASGVLVFSFIGYANQEIPISSRSVIDVTMVADVQSLTEVANLKMCRISLA